MKGHRETHRGDRAGWLRAAVLGANDGLISTASLVIGMVMAGTGAHAVLMAGLAGWVAGALSMAAGEYVSVSSQADAERADLALERRELQASPEAERRELAAIYESRGLTPALAEQVARELTAHDALGAHARDELGITEASRARPLQAAVASAAAFSAGALLPLAAILWLPARGLVPALGGVTLLMLFALGALAAQLGGGAPGRAAVRVGFWGAAAMLATAGVGHLFGRVIA